MIRISSNYFVAGACVNAGFVTHAAPILKYMIGWTQERALSYCRQKGWTYELLPL